MYLLSKWPSILEKTQVAIDVLYAHCGHSSTPLTWGDLAHKLIVSYAQSHNADQTVVDAIRQFPEKRYQNMAEVQRALGQVK